MFVSIVRHNNNNYTYAKSMFAALVQKHVQVQVQLLVPVHVEIEVRDSRIDQKACTRVPKKVNEDYVAEEFKCLSSSLIFVEKKNQV